jgi:Na+/melibiose symporter-like transporter
MADVDDYGEWKTGKRITGISFSGNLFFLKVGLAVAGAMVGFLLSWYGYDAGAKAQSASAINGIMLLFTVIPGVGYLITAGVTPAESGSGTDENYPGRPGKTPRQLS